MQNSATILFVGKYHLDVYKIHFLTWLINKKSLSDSFTQDIANRENARMEGVKNKNTQIQNKKWY